MVRTGSSPHLVSLPRLVLCYNDHGRTEYESDNHCPGGCVFIQIRRERVLNFRSCVIELRSLLVAAFTLCVYDWILLCADEYELVGRSRLSLGKILYYFVRRLLVLLSSVLNLQQSRVTTPLGLTFAIYRALPLKPALLKAKFTIDLSPYRGELSRHVSRPSSIVSSC